MIHKIYRGSDAMINISLKDSCGNKYRVADTVKFDIKFFTTDPDVYVGGSYAAQKYTNIVPRQYFDTVVIEDADLETLEDGIIYYEYYARVVNDSFNNYFYDEIIKGQTNIVLNTNISYTKECEPKCKD